MGIQKAAHAGEIRLSLELLTGSMGESNAEYVVQHVVDQLVEHLKTTDPGRLWKITKAEAKFEPWKEGHSVTYTPHLSAER